MAVSEDSQPDHYATLGLSPDATSMDVENAFHARVREHLAHSNVTDKPIRERARQVGLAYETLRDPAKRRAYDETRAAAANHSPAAPAQSAARVPPPLVMFTPPEIAKEPADEVAEARPPNPTPAPPEPEPEAEREWIDPYASDEPVENTPVVTPTPIEPPATPTQAEPVAAQPVAEPEPEIIPPDEPVADEPAEPTSNWRPAAASVVPLTFVDEPAADEAATVPWRTKRPKGRGLLAIAALVAVLGIGGLVFTQVGNRSGKQRVQAVLPVAVTSSQVPASAPPAGPPPAQVNGVPPGLADQAASTTPAIPTGPVSAAAARIPTEARTATAAAPPPPAATVEVKLPPPAPSAAVPAATDAATTAAAAPPANPAPPPAAPPPPPPPPVRPQVSAQPFPRWLGGGIMNSDNPRGQYVGTVSVRFTVQPNGRVGDCRPVASSGNPALDANTCSLVEQRLRFSPALNAQGEPISTEVRTSYTWGRTTRRR